MSLTIVNMEEEGLEFIMQPMRYTYYFHEDISVESVQDLIDMLMNYPAVDLFVDTPGGSLNAMKALLHFINNSHPDIVIYLTGFVASAGTMFLTDCTKEVILTDDLDCLLFHLADRGRDGEFRKTLLDWNVLQEQLKDWNNKYLDAFTKLGLNKKEIKDISEGKDVIFYKKDFKRLKINQK